MSFPRFRNLEAFPFEEEGKKQIALRDPLGVISGIALVSPEIYLVAAHCDGTRSIESIGEAIRTGFGVSIDLPSLRAIVQALEEKCLLEGPAFERAWKELQERFAASSTRAAFHAGAVYPESASQAAKHLETMFGSVNATQISSMPRCILSPHIDYARGNLTYAKTWSALRQAQAPDLFLVLGTSHAPMRSLLGLTRKDYETPFGTATTDRDFVERLASRLPESGFADEIAHRSEHSVELQIHLLRYLFPKSQFAPVLCGDLAGRCIPGKGPKSSKLVEDSVGALREAIAQGGRIAIVLGADLAHVGPRFGAPPTLEESYLRRVEDEDLRSLACAAALDAEGFFHAVIEGGDPRKVCGLTPIYLGLRCLENARGRILEYRQCTSEDQSVTIAGMIWE